MDMSKYMDIFRVESEKYIKELSDSLLVLENDPENTEQVNTLFRAAHTFKGMAATMGFKQIVELTHEMESLIDGLRTRQTVLNSSLIDVLLICVDTLEGLVENVCGSEGNKPEKEKKDSVNKYEYHPDVYEVLKTLRKVNDSPEKASIQKAGDKSLSAEKKSEEGGEESGKIKDNAKKCNRDNEVSKTEETNKVKNAAKEIYLPEKAPAYPKSSPKVKIVQNPRISTKQLDKLMNLVGELVINRSRINELTRDLKSKELEAALSDFHKLTRELQEEVIEARMVPLDHITYIYPRMIRDLARVQNKKIDFIIKGKEIKLDRTILEEIGDSLVHLLRNAVDHGIEIPEKRVELRKKENGTVLITASRQENFVLIRIEDDGCGIDTNEIRKVALKKGIISRESAEQLQEEEAMQLIFTPGLSTSDNVTDISGRGIGMDVVKNRVERLGGSVKVESKPGLGSSFELKLPLTVAVYQAMLLRVGKEKYAIPFTSIVKNIEVSSQEIKHIKGQEVILIDNKILPLFRLKRQFQLPDDDDENNIFVVLVEKHGQYTGIIVDELLGKQEVIVKSFKSKLLDDTRGFAGATILGDGSIILIIDVNSLI
ncbi:Signal transduction histidine kinase CheA [Methanosarcina barkeri str. Wiesmoor]|uniref:Chemotaxis protein CheA n=2 Tax=Methanosarcina barkeri TaxID=2208 RepID=A0A0E3QQM8_METBA|nr:chemotaxis protein CheA [Methanosarcina barkeri]AKB52990.1 Signal transduction histidine kinase CheA [Methanosarcina barkeri str. Wiesmoor]